MTIKISVLKGDLNGENRSGAFLFLLGIYVSSYFSLEAASWTQWQNLRNLDYGLVKVSALLLKLNEIINKIPLFIIK